MSVLDNIKIAMPDEYYLFEHIADSEECLKRLEGRKIETVLDIGAHVGIFSIAFAKSGAKFILAVEPSPINFYHLTQNILNNDVGGNILSMQCAVARQSFESATLYGANSSGQMSLRFAEKCQYIQKGNTFKVTTISFKCILAEMLDKFGTLDLLKIDIEGGEWDILTPAITPLLKRVKFLDMEFHPMDNGLFFDNKTNGYEANMMKDCKKWLEDSCGFKEELGPHTNELMFYRKNINFKE